MRSMQQADRQRRSALPLLPPDPSVCSRTSYNRFKKIVVHAHTDATNILAENDISSANLSRIMTAGRTE